MDSEKAEVLFENGAILLILDFPTGSEFGIDYNSWTVGPNFKGIKMIPSGIHFIYYSSKSTSGEASPRSGFFYNFAPKEIVLKKWDAKLEDICHNQPAEGEILRLQENKEELDRFLGPYPYESYKKWISLSNHISKETVALLQPECGSIYAAAQFESKASTSQSRELDRKAEEASLGSQDSNLMKLPQMKSVAETIIRYSVIPQKFPDNATPAEITMHSIDSSYSFDLLLSQRFQNNSENILGEIQFAFICFIIGQNYDSFEQWKKLVHLLCTSGNAALKYPNTFLSFISLLHFQIREIPSDFFVDIVTCNNFLTVTLHELFQNILSEGIDLKLRKRGLSFKKHLTDKFKWDFTSEPDEYAPVVVDLETC